MAIMVAMLELCARLPSWLVVLAAVIAPIVIALAFLTVMAWVNRPVSAQEYNSDPMPAFM